VDGRWFWVSQALWSAAFPHTASMDPLCARLTRVQLAAKYKLDRCVWSLTAEDPCSFCCNVADIFSSSILDAHHISSLLSSSHIPSESNRCPWKSWQIWRGSGWRGETFNHFAVLSVLRSPCSWECEGEEQVDSTGEEPSTSARMNTKRRYVASQPRHSLH